MTDATATTEKTDSGNVKIESTGPAARRLTITIPPETIAEKLVDAMGTLAAETALPGFRKGRAPKKLIERRFGEVVRVETKNQLIADAYASALEEHEIKPVGEPQPVEDVEDLVVVEGQSLTFSVDVEVMPEFELPAYEGIEIKKPILDITDEHVKSELERYCTQLGTSSRIDSDFQPGDKVVGPGRVTRKGEDEPFFSHEQVVIVVPGEEDGGRGQVLGLLVDGLAELLAGKRVTDQLKIQTTAPEGHEREDIRGADLEIEFEISQAERTEPAAIEQVVELMGLGTEEILQEQIKMSLEQRRDEEQATAMRRQAADHLVEKVDFELPQRLSEEQVTRTLERQRMQMLYDGMDAEEVESRLAEIRAASEVGTRKQLKLFFLLRSLADHFGIEVTQQETNGRVAAMAARRGVRPEQLMNELSQTGRLAEVTNQIRESKALDRVVHTAKVSEVTAEEWRKFAAGNDADEPTPKKKTTKKTGKKKTTKKA